MIVYKNESMINIEEDLSNLKKNYFNEKSLIIENYKI